MRSKIGLCALGLMGLFTTTMTQSNLVAQVPVSKQSSARPGNASVFSAVMQSGSDARSSAFNRDYLPIIRKIADEKLLNNNRLERYDLFELESSKLFLKKRTAQPIRVYYIAGLAGFKNSLGFAYNLAGATNPGRPFLIFPDAASSAVYPSSQVFIREGDFVDIDFGGNGWQLDFFLNPNGAGGWGNSYTWWNTKSKNSDGMQHVAALAIPNSPYLLMGFEDLPGGGDLDFNDLVFVVDIGFENNDTLIEELALPN